MKKILASAALFAMPALVFAQNLESSLSSLPRIINQLTRAANALIPFLLAIAVLFFIWGVITFVLATSADDKAKARGYIIWGIIGIAVIVSLFGLVRLLQNTFGISGNAPVTYPQIQTP